MKRPFLLGTLTILAFSLFAQADKSQFLYTSDGKLIGNRKDLVKECADEMDDAEMPEADKLEVCECILYQMASHLTYKDFTKMIEKDDFDFEKVFEDKKHKDMANGVMQCVFGMMKNDSPGGFRELFMAECVKGFEEEAGVALASVDANVYCSCMLDKISENADLTENFMKQLNDEDSPLIAEAALPCVLEAMKSDEDDLEPAAPDTITYIDTATMEEIVEVVPAKPAEKKVSEDIQGDIVSVEVPLIKYLSTYALKVKIGTVEKRFILDSGASDVLIDKEMEKELMAAGILKKGDEVGEKIYSLADGSKVKAKVYVLNGLQVGGFTVDNVMAGVIGEDASLLLGKSFLDKFSKWNIDNAKKTLYLEK